MQPARLLCGVAAAAAGPLLAAAPAVGLGRPDMGLAILLGAFSLETGAVGGGSASPEAVGGGNGSPEAVGGGSESPEAVTASGSSTAVSDGSRGGGGSATASAAGASGELIANVHCARTECPDCHFSVALGVLECVQGRHSKDINVIL